MTETDAAYEIILALSRRLIQTFASGDRKDDPVRREWIMKSLNLMDLEFPDARAAVDRDYPPERGNVERSD